MTSSLKICPRTPTSVSVPCREIHECPVGPCSRRLAERFPVSLRRSTTADEVHSSRSARAGIKHGAGRARCEEVLPIAVTAPVACLPGESDRDQRLRAAHQLTAG